MTKTIQLITYKMTMTIIEMLYGDAKVESPPLRHKYLQALQRFVYNEDNTFLCIR
ncbi:MAG: hypothetical protein J5801_01410 [Bacteroidales bacterium]|nr:hypothetical protein [Bacteroidales bacterium]